ncbi:MAG: hypothetical protein IKG82_02430 [Oscillospiraceae bacterium]|nr:hypothetical protein [Oscillospiraceae bacterium]
MEAFDVRALFEQYCEKEAENRYFCESDGRTYEIIPASEEQLTAFRTGCQVRNVPENAAEELLAYYRQNNNFFQYFTCDDPAVFEWWEDAHELWLGCVDMDVFRFCADTGKYTIGDAGSASYGREYEFDTLRQMLEGHFRGI